MSEKRMTTYERYENAIQHLEGAARKTEGWMQETWLEKARYLRTMQMRLSVEEALDDGLME